MANLGSNRCANSEKKSDIFPKLKVLKKTYDVKNDYQIIPIFRINLVSFETKNLLLLTLHFFMTVALFFL